MPSPRRTTMRAPKGSASRARGSSVEGMGLGGSARAHQREGFCAAQVEAGVHRSRGQVRVSRNSHPRHFAILAKCWAFCSKRVRHASCVIPLVNDNTIPGVTPRNRLWFGGARLSTPTLHWFGTTGPRGFLCSDFSVRGPIVAGEPLASSRAWLLGPSLAPAPAVARRGTCDFVRGLVRCFAR